MKLLNKHLMCIIEMQETASDVITLSSDDEFETPPPPKKKKTICDTPLKNKNDAMKILNGLKEISAYTENAEEKTRIKKQKEGDSLTIIIESDEVISAKVECKKDTTDNLSDNDNANVVVIDEEPSEENSLLSDKNINNSSTIIVDDPSEESEDLAENIKASSPLQQNENISTEKQENSQIDDSKPSTSTASEAHKLLDEFFETCTNSVRGTKYEVVIQKFPKMRKYFNDCEHLHNEVSLKRMLQDNIKTTTFSPPDAVICFHRLWSYFLDHLRGSSIEISENDLPKVKKLEKTCKLLLKRLKQLEESELNFDDEYDSTYIQIDRYSQRLNKVYNKYCQLINRNPYYGRLLYEKINFVSSNYVEINRAITKFCKRNAFPTYYDIEKCIRKCVNKNNLSLTEKEIVTESESCFKKLGNLMQLRRKKELYDIHCGFITLNEDPANNDPELKVKLEESLNEGEKRMKEIVDKYANLQENNVNPNLSEDSDDSHYKSSDSESGE